MNTRNGRQLARLRCYAPCAGLALLSLGGTCAQADVKITMEISTTSGSGAATPNSPADPAAAVQGNGSPSGSSLVAPQTVTIYYKGDLARREAAGGTITLYDGGKNQVTVMNPADKTYSTFATKDAFKWLNTAGSSSGADAFGGKLPEGMHEDTSVEFDKTGLLQSRFDAETQKYTLAATERMVMEAPQGGGGFGGGRGGSGGGGGRRGGRGGGGGYGGGQGGGQGGAGGGRAGANRGLPLTEFQGDFWLADDALLPGGDKSPLLPLLQGTVSDPAILKSLYGKIARLKRVPLSTSVTTRASAPGGQFSASLVTTTMQVRSITPGALDDTLFQVPADYQKSKPDAVLRQNIAYRATEHR